MIRRCVVTAVVVLFTPAVHAAEYWVAPGGDDANGGSEDAPFATIPRADEVAMPGDVVHVMAGVYDGTFDTFASGSDGAPITFVAEPKWGAQLVASGAPWISRGDWVDIVDFEYTGDAHVGMLTLGSHTRYLGNWVHHLAPMCDGSGGAAIDAGNYEATDCDMIGNVVHDIWADDLDGTPCNRVQGLYHSIQRGTIANNIAYNISGWGIHTWHAAREVTITNNLVFGAGNGGIVVGADAVTAEGFLVANNIIAHNEMGIMEFGDTGPRNRYANNLLFDNAVFDMQLQNGIVDEGTVVEDPLFVDWQPDGTGDYRLMRGSPAIDAGIADGAPLVDLDGVARPQGEGFDIGPYEYFVDAGTSSGGDEGSSSGGGVDDAGSSGGGSLDSASSDPDDGGNEGALTDVASDTSTSTAVAGDERASGCGCSTRTDPSAWPLALLVLACGFVPRRGAPRGHATAPRRGARTPASSSSCASFVGDAACSTTLVFEADARRRRA